MSWMQTYTGGRFYVTDMARTKFALRDIAHALSNMCRFGGHTREFYSVAQHSLMVADIVKARGGTPVQELWALMHDATEAYMIDIPTPLKATLAGYKKREDKLMQLIADGLELPPHGEDNLLPAIVKLADGVALVTEARQLVHGTSKWTKAYRKIRAYQVTISPLSPAEVELEFLKRYRDIVSRIAQAVSA